MRLPEDGEAFAYASFGDDGTTATVTAGSNIIHISRYLGAGESGVFSVNVEEVDEPWCVSSRAHQLMDASDDWSGIAFYQYSPVDVFEKVWNRPPDIDFVHGRWPRFKRTSDEKEDVVVYDQCYVSRGTVFKHRRFESKRSRLQCVDESSLMLMPQWYRIVDQDFVQMDCGFNCDGPNRNYHHQLGPHGYGVYLAHQGFSSRNPNDNLPNTVGLVIAVSVNGEIRELEKVRRTEWGDFAEDGYAVKLKPGEDGFWVDPAKPLEICQAFRLQLMPETCSWQDWLVSGREFLAMNEVFEAGKFREISFSEDGHLNFLLRRNLEHILSVCSLPITTSSRMNETNGADAGESDTRPAEGKRIALTCGNVSGHRVVTSASL